MPKKFDAQHDARRHRRITGIRAKTQDPKSFDFGKLDREVWKLLGETPHYKINLFRDVVRLTTEKVALFCMRRHGIMGRKLRSEILDATKLYLSTIESMRQIRIKKPYATVHNNKAYAQFVRVEKLTKDRFHQILGSDAELYLHDVHWMQRKMLDEIGLI